MRVDGESGMVYDDTQVVKTIGMGDYQRPDGFKDANGAAVFLAPEDVVEAARGVVHGTKVSRPISLDTLFLLALSETLDMLDALMARGGE